MEKSKEIRIAYNSRLIELNFFLNHQDLCKKYLSFPLRQYRRQFLYNLYLNGHETTEYSNN